MVSAETHTTIWLASSLFWVGALLVPLGLFLLLAPTRVARLGEIMNRWVSTQKFFDAINRPRYQEKFVYRHHRIFGIVVTLLSVCVLYMLVFYSGMEVTVGYFQGLAQSGFENWLFTNLYYILVFVVSLALVCGIVIFIRPSALKRVEAWSNQWVATEDKLKPLDEVHEIPGGIFSSRPRLFGVFVLLGACYIMYMTRGVVL